MELASKRLRYIKDFSVFSNCALCHSDLVRRLILIQACETRSINWRKRNFLSLVVARGGAIRVITFSQAVRTWIARQISKSSRLSSWPECRAEVYTGWLIGKLNVALWIGHLLVAVNVGVNLIKFVINLAWRNAPVIFSHFCFIPDRRFSSYWLNSDLRISKYQI